MKAVAHIAGALQEHAVFGDPIHEGRLRLDQTPREGALLEVGTPFGSSGTTIEDTSVFDEAHRRTLERIHAASKFSSTGIILGAPSLRGYLPVLNPARELSRVARTAAADLLQALVGVASATPSALRSSLPHLQPTRISSALLLERAEQLEAGEATADPPAYKAFKQLARWLDADEQDVAQAVGVGRTTPSSWQRAGHEPRARTVRKLYEYHSTLNSLRRRLGDDGVRGWLFARAPQHERGALHRDLLLAGDLQAVQASVDSILFRRLAEPLPDLSWAPDASESDAGTVESTEKPGLTGRRARRARLR